MRLHVSGGQLQATELTRQPAVLGGAVPRQSIPRHRLATLLTHAQVAPTVAHVHRVVGGGDRPLAAGKGQGEVRAGQSRSETESPTDPARPAAPGAVTRLQFIWPHPVAVQRPAGPSVVADSTDVTSRL